MKSFLTRPILRNSNGAKWKRAKFSALKNIFNSISLGTKAASPQRAHEKSYVAVLCIADKRPELKLFQKSHHRKTKFYQIVSSLSFYWLFSSFPPSKYRVLCLFYVLLRLNARCYAVMYEEQICSQLSICSPRQISIAILLHFDKVK